MAVLRLMRFPNLVVIALTQWLIADLVIGKTLLRFGISPTLAPRQTLGILLATACLSGAAYVVNDILDRHIDAINRPNKLIVDKLISISSCSWLAAMLFITGFALSLMLAFELQELEWLWLYPMFGTLLALYPRLFKTRPFAGNLLIAASCAGAAGLMWLAERPAWEQLPPEPKHTVTWIIGLFMGYAFLATWIRELVKDLEDAEGDILLGRRTLPAHWGVKKVKFFLHLLVILLSGAIALGLWVLWAYAPQWRALALSIGLLCWAGILQIQLHQATDKRHYHSLSQHWKFFMLGGLGLMALLVV